MNTILQVNSDGSVRFEVSDKNRGVKIVPDEFGNGFHVNMWKNDDVMDLDSEEKDLLFDHRDGLKMIQAIHEWMD